MKGRWFKFVTFTLTCLMLTQPVGAAGSLRVEKVTSELNEPQLQFSSSYPHISGLKDSAAQQRFNVIVRERAEKSQKTAQFAAKTLKDSTARVTGGFNFAVKRNGGGVLSMVLNEQLTVGGGKGMVTQTGVSINTVSGKAYRLGGLFEDNVDYVGVLSSEIKKQIRARGLESKQLTVVKKIKSNEGFYLTSDALVIFFNQYEYFPYECGIQEFTIPLQSLNGILKPQMRL